VLTRIIEQSAGNVLFLEELIRAAAEGKLEKPETVLAMLQGRIGRFGAELRHAVRAASIFGQTFWRGGVATVLGLAPNAPEVETWLTALVDTEVIEACARSRLQDEKEYGFRHALIRDAAYGLFSEENRAAGHRLAGEFLKRAGERDAKVLAEHFQLGGLPEEAATYYSLAAEQQIAITDLEGALLTTERGLACRPSRRTRGELRACQTQIHLWRADLEAVQRDGSEALALLEPGGVGWSRCMGGVFLALMLLNRTEQFAAYLDMFLRTAPRTEAVADYLEAASKLLITLTCLGKTETGHGVLMRMEDVRAQAAHPSPAADGWVKYGAAFYTYLLRPTPYRALTAAEQARASFEEAGDRRMSASACAPLGAIQTELGALHLAEETLRAGYTVVGPVQEHLIYAYLAFQFSLLLAEYGPPERLEEARAMAQTVLDRVGASTLYAGHAQCALAYIHLRQGDLLAAESAARKGREILRITPGMSEPALVVLIESLLKQNRGAEACEIAAEGLTLLAKLGCGGSIEARLRLAISEAFQASGDIERARSELRETLNQIQLRAADILDAGWKHSYLTHPLCIRAQELGRAWGLDFVIS
jgi:tetratricopeptide (TPR) repeat protein